MSYLNPHPVAPTALMGASSRAALSSEGSGPATTEVTPADGDDVEVQDR